MNNKSLKPHNTEALCEDYRNNYALSQSDVHDRPT